jgi:hypothetical protein
MMLGVLRHGPAADARIQLVQDVLQPALSHLASGHLQQDLAHFRVDVFDCPTNLAIADVWIAGVVEF